MKKMIKSKLEQLLLNTGDMALKRRAKNIIYGLELHDGSRVLDVGCGDGYYLHLLSNLGLKLKLTGTDFDDVGLKKARKNLGKKVVLKKGDLMKRLTFKSNTFDKVVMSEVAEHLPNDVKGLKEVKRVMKTDAILCLTVPNQNYPFLWDPVNWTLEHLFDTHIKSGFFAGLWNQHIRLYKPNEIRAAVESAGFKVIEVKSLTYWCLPFNHYIVNLIARGLASCSFAKSTHKSLNKFTTRPTRAWYLDLAFGAVNLLDRLNDVFPVNGHGVAVFIKAIKK